MNQYVHVDNLDGGSGTQFKDFRWFSYVTHNHVLFGPAVTMRELAPTIHTHVPDLLLHVHHIDREHRVVPLHNEHGPYTSINEVLSLNEPGLTLGAGHLATGERNERLYGVYLPKGATEHLELYGPTSSVTLEQALSYLSKQRSDEIREYW